jgi:hypothetical protein
MIEITFIMIIFYSGYYNSLLILYIKRHDACISSVVKLSDYCD